MKIRKGFVSNSSTSSYTCDVCGETVAERDLCLSEAEMFSCAKGHTVCNEHRIGEYEGDESYEIPIEFCPICQLKKFMDSDLLSFALKKLSMSKNELAKEIQANFKTYDGFRKSLS